MLKLDTHTHIVPESWPDLASKYDDDRFAVMVHGDGQQRIYRNGRFLRAVWQSAFDAAYRCMDPLGLAGVQIGSHCNDWNLDAEELFPLFEAAGGSAKQARDKDFQAILPLCGKILNTWEVESGSVLASDERRLAPPTLDHQSVSLAAPSRTPLTSSRHEWINRYNTAMDIFKVFQIEAAHRLPNVPAGHKCARLHGHSFRIEVHLAGPIAEETGWVMDFADIKAAFAPVFDALDHNYLNEVPGLENPTSERLAEWIWMRLNKALPQLSEIVVHETCTSGCRYRGA